MTIEFTQENFTVEVDEQNNVVEIRYEGLNAGLLQALTTRVDVLEDEIDTVLGESNGSIGTLTTTVNGLSVQVTAVTNNLTAEIAARIAGDEANSAALIATEADLAADIAAETAARGAALIAEAAARNGAISAATAPIISAHNGLAATVAGLSGDVDAVELSQAGLVVSQAALTAEVDALDVSFVALSADFDDTNAAVLAESSARAVAEAALGERIDGLSWKPPVRVATTAAGTLATSFENGDTVDGIVLATGDRILIKDQAAGAENGIYVVNVSGAPTRAADMNASAEILGAITLVTEGTANGDKLFFCSTNAAITLGTTALTFAEISGGGGGSSPTTTAGDLIKRGASVDERLAIGAEGEVLTVVSGEPAWAAAAGGGGSSSLPEFSGCLTRNSTNQSISAGVYTDLAIGSEIYDTDSYYPGTGSKFYAPVTGTYLFTATSNFSSGGACGLLISKNAAPSAGTHQASSYGTEMYRNTLTWTGQLTAGDYLHIQVLCSGANTLNNTGQPLEVSMVLLSGGLIGGVTAGMVFRTESPGVSVKFNAHETVPGTGTPWTWDAAEWDTDGFWSVGAPTRLTIPAGLGGKYLVFVCDAPTSATSSDVWLLKNGSNIRVDGNGTTWDRHAASFILDLVPGDYLEVGCWASHEVHASMTRFGLHRMNDMTLVYDRQATPVDDGAHLLSNSTQTIANNTDTVVVFDTETRDDGGHADLGVSTSRLTAPNAGWYVITGGFYWDADVNSLRVLRLCKNGATEAYQIACDVRPATSGYSMQQVTAVAYLNAGDYVNLVAWQNSGGTRTGYPIGDMPFLSWHRLGIASAPANPVNDGARVKRTTNQSIANGTQTALSFDSEVRDDGAYWDAGAPTRLTITNAGWYLINGGLEWDANSTQTRYALIGKNGSSVLCVESRTAGTGDNKQNLSAVAYLAAGDYVTLDVIHSAGVSLNVLAQNDGPYFSIHRLGTNQLPTGGTTGQVLAKASDTTADVTWVNADAAAITSASLAPYIGRSLYPVQPVSPHSLDDEFDSTFDTTTKWTVRIGSAGNAAITDRGLRLTGSIAVTQPISGASWEFTMRMLTNDLSVDNGLLFFFGRTASSTALYFGGYYRTGSYPFFYAATLPLTGGWTATNAGASTNNPTWLNHAKMMNHRVALSGGILTYTLGEDSCADGYRKPHTSNTTNLSTALGGDCDVIGFFHPLSGPSLIEWFRKTG